MTIQVRSLLGALMFLLLSGMTLARDRGVLSDRESVVRQFVDAFNQQNAERMGTLVSDDVQWLSIAGNTVSTEASSKQELLLSMRAYFKSCPSCRSHLSEAIVSDARVSAVEVATWSTPRGSHAQKSISVYEFSGLMIHRVYYFPAEKHAADDLP